MQYKRSLAFVLVVPFVLLTLYTIHKVGYLGIFEYQFLSPAGWQVGADLVIACMLLLSWIIPEAKRKGRNPWPFVLITVVLGSIGPLLYILLGSGTEQDEHSRN